MSMLLTHMKNVENDKMASAEATNVCSSVIRHLSYIHHLFVTHSFPGCTHAKMIYLCGPNDSCFAISLLAPFSAETMLLQNVVGWEGVIFICGHMVPVTMEIPNSFWYLYVTTELKENNPLFTFSSSAWKFLQEIPVFALK